MISNYGRYIAEREGKQIVESESGFATYSFPILGSCYIEDIYVVPEQRHSGIGRQMADEISEIAKKKGCSRLIGTVKPAAVGSTYSMKSLIAYGFKLESCDGTLIYLTKEL